MILSQNFVLILCLITVDNYKVIGGVHLRKVVKIPNKKTVKNWDTTNMCVNSVIIVLLQDAP